MANELNIGLTTGRTITARLILGGAYVGSTITCTEAPASSGHYSGSVPGGIGTGHYSVVFLEGSTIVGNGALLWDGIAERTELTTPTVTQFEARTLVAANYFDPATDTVATVTSITNAVVLPSIPANWLTAAGLATDAVTEIQSGLATSASIAALPTVAQIEARTLPSANYFDPATDAVATVTSITNAVTLPSIPSDWITAAGLATDAVAEIQSGIATSSALSAVATQTGRLDDLIENSGGDRFTAKALETAPTSSGGGGLAQETLDAIAAILGHTSYIANAVEAGDLPDAAQVQAAGFTTDRNNALIRMAKQLGLVAGVTATHSPTAIVVSDGDGSTTITDNGGGSYTVEIT